jgi:glucose/mannose-6-phosphate isomerase
MEKIILDFPKQFAYQPVIKNLKKYKKAKKFIVLGMGGSHLAAGLIKNCEPSTKIIVHKNYGLPKLTDKELKDYLIIANSYSGNTEEVLDGLKKALQKKLNVLVIATGSKLISLAQKNNLAYIQMPDFKIPPRSALGFSCRALLKAMGQTQAYETIGLLAKQLKPKTLQNKGQKLAKLLNNKIPVIYASAKNCCLAYNWKIKLNETGKIPAFCNTLPELNHNEMNGFDATTKTKDLTNKFSFIFLEDEQDDKRLQKRMRILAQLYKQKKLPVWPIKLSGPSHWQKIFNNLILADWVSYYLAKYYGRDPEPVPMVEQFKKLMKS